MEGSQVAIPQRLTAHKLRIRDIKDARFIESTERFEPSLIETPTGIRAGRVRIMGTVVKRFVSNEGKPFAFITVDDATDTIRVKIWQDVAIFDGVEEGDIVDVIGKARKYEDEIYIAPEVVRRVEDPNEETLRRLEVLEFLANRGKKTLERGAETVFKEEESVEIVMEEDDTTETESPVMEELDGSEEEEKHQQKKPVGSLAVFAKPKQKEGDAALGSDTTKESSQRDASLRDVLLAVIKSMESGSGAEIEDVIATVEKQTGEPPERIEGAIEALLNEGTCYEPRSGRIKLLATG